MIVKKKELVTTFILICLSTKFRSSIIQGPNIVLRPVTVCASRVINPLSLGGADKILHYLSLGLDTLEVAILMVESGPDNNPGNLRGRDGYYTFNSEQDAIRAFRKSLRGCKDPVKISKWYSESPKIWLNRVNARLIQIEKLNKSAKPIVND